MKKITKLKFTQEFLTSAEVEDHFDFIVKNFYNKNFLHYVK